MGDINFGRVADDVFQFVGNIPKHLNTGTEHQSQLKHEEQTFNDVSAFMSDWGYPRPSDNELGPYENRGFSYSSAGEITTGAAIVVGTVATGGALAYAGAGATATIATAGGTSLLASTTAMAGTAVGTKIIIGGVAVNTAIAAGATYGGAQAQTERGSVYDASGGQYAYQNEELNRQLTHMDNVYDILSGTKTITNEAGEAVQIGRNNKVPAPLHLELMDSYTAIITSSLNDPLIQVQNEIARGDIDPNNEAQIAEVNERYNAGFDPQFSFTLTPDFMMATYFADPEHPWGLEPSADAKQQAEDMINILEQRGFDIPEAFQINEETGLPNDPNVATPEALLEFYSTSLSPAGDPTQIQDLMEFQSLDAFQAQVSARFGLAQDQSGNWIVNSGSPRGKLVERIAGSEAEQLATLMNEIDKLQDPTRTDYRSLLTEENNDLSVQMDRIRTQASAMEDLLQANAEIERQKAKESMKSTIFTSAEKFIWDFIGSIFGFETDFENPFISDDNEEEIEGEMNVAREMAARIENWQLANIAAINDAYGTEIDLESLGVSAENQSRPLGMLITDNPDLAPEILKQLAEQTGPEISAVRAGVVSEMLRTNPQQAIDYLRDGGLNREDRAALFVLAVNDPAILGTLLNNAEQLNIDEISQALSTDIAQAVREGTGIAEIPGIEAMLKVLEENSPEKITELLNELEGEALLEMMRYLRDKGIDAGGASLSSVASSLENMYSEEELANLDEEALEGLEAALQYLQLQDGMTNGTTTLASQISEIRAQNQQNVGQERG